MSASIFRAGLGVWGWGLKGSLTQTSMLVSIMNFKKRVSRCVLLASSLQPPVPVLRLLAPSPQSPVPGFTA